ncbi:hypothetical protein [Massilia sp. CF038]|uniref:hypothetical protein n=1 Tax=Massilia sp. CF038 TaxID=1881045 RepID=UPI001160F469|nr:hypothetical protein [Massilia sp. CF038]
MANDTPVRMTFPPASKQQERLNLTIQPKSGIGTNHNKELGAHANVMSARTRAPQHAKERRQQHGLPAQTAIQAKFWERTPQGAYIWHTGPVTRIWKERIDLMTRVQETKPGNGWIFSGTYGVWERKTLFNAATAQSPLLESAISSVQSIARQPTMENVEQQMGPESSANLAYAAKMIGLTLGVGAIVTIGATFITFSMPAWVSAASRLGSIGTLVARLFKWAYDVRGAERRRESKFKPHMRNGAFVTISFVQLAVELSWSGGKYVFLPSGWHYEFYELLVAIKNATRSSAPQPVPVGAENA